MLDADFVVEVDAPTVTNGAGNHADDDAPLNVIDAGDDHGPIPPRGRLLGNDFCRRFAGSLIAEGGAGKTALRLAQLLSPASGTLPGLALRTTEGGSVMRKQD